MGGQGWKGLDVSVSIRQTSIPLHSTAAHPIHPPAVLVNAGKQPLVTSTVVLVLLPLPLMIPFPRTPEAVQAEV